MQRHITNEHNKYHCTRAVCRNYGQYLVRYRPKDGCIVRNVTNYKSLKLMSIISRMYACELCGEWIIRCRMCEECNRFLKFNNFALGYHLYHMNRFHGVRTSNYLTAAANGLWCNIQCVKLLTNNAPDNLFWTDTMMDLIPQLIFVTCGDDYIIARSIVGMKSELMSNHSHINPVDEFGVRKDVISEAAQMIMLYGENPTCTFCGEEYETFPSFDVVLLHCYTHKTDAH